MDYAAKLRSPTQQALPNHETHSVHGRMMRDGLKLLPDVHQVFFSDQKQGFRPLLLSGKQRVSTFRNGILP